MSHVTFQDERSCFTNYFLQQSFLHFCLRRPAMESNKATRNEKLKQNKKLGCWDTFSLSSLFLDSSFSLSQTNQPSKQARKQTATHKQTKKQGNEQTDTHTQTNKHTGHKQANEPTHEATRKRTMQHKRIWRLSLSFGLSLVFISPSSCKHNAQIIRLVIRRSRLPTCRWCLREFLTTLLSSLWGGRCDSVISEATRW